MFSFEKIKLKLWGQVFKKFKKAYRKEYHFTEDWFTHNIPVWSKLLKEMTGKKNVKALEIGTFQGRSALWLLENILTHSTASLTCIDLYPGPFKHVEQIFKNNLKIGRFENRVNLFVQDSLSVLPKLQAQKFDLIYMDGHHEGERIFKESEMCWPILKTGGVLIFDDYLWPAAHHVGQSPKEGIENFLNKRSEAIEILHKDYQVIVKKIDV